MAEDATEDQSMPVILHRLSALERRVEVGFTHLDQRLDTLGFVRSDVYAAERSALEQRVVLVENKLLPGGETMNEIADAKRPGVWALTVVGGAFLVALVGFLVQIALSGAST